MGLRRRVKLIDTDIDARVIHRRNVALPTASQWLEIEARHLAGETVIELAKQYKVSREAIYKRVGNGNSGGRGMRKVARSRHLASTLATVETSIAKLPIIEQVMIRNLADYLKSISRNLASAAELGAKSANHLSFMAHENVSQMRPDADPKDNSGHLATAMVLTTGANEAAKIGLNLLASNKEHVRDLERDPDSNIIDITPKLIDDSDPVESSKTYQRLVAGVR